MSTILVPIDLSEETPEVIEYAAMLARRNRSQLVLMLVARPAVAGVPGASGPAAGDVEELERLERYLRDEGLQVSTAIRAGEPAREIVEFGGAIAADCIILGRRDHAAGAAEPANSVARYVEQCARCTVVTVP
jgi:nucleotide-binding universal stress UspA family protein